MDDRDRAAPIALARNAPVAEAVIDRALAQSEAFELFDGGRNGIIRRKAVQEVRIIDRARSGIGGVGHLMAVF